MLGYTWAMVEVNHSLTIGDFVTLLRARHGDGASAFVPSRANGRTQHGLCVVYSDGGKVYTYEGSNYAIAERMGLLPTWAIFRNGEMVAHEWNEELARNTMAALMDEDKAICAKWECDLGKWEIRLIS